MSYVLCLPSLPSSLSIIHCPLSIRMSSYLDILPSHERASIRKHLRSPEAYEALREKVKGPEDLEKALRQSERMAEAHLALESEPRSKESLKGTLERDIREQGVERIMEAAHLSPEARAAIEQGRFDIAVDEHPDSHEDALMVLPEGTIGEKVPVNQIFSERYTQELLQSSGGHA